MVKAAGAPARRKLHGYRSEPDYTVPLLAVPPEGKAAILRHLSVMYGKRRAESDCRSVRDKNRKGLLVHQLIDEQVQSVAGPKCFAKRVALGMARHPASPCPHPEDFAGGDKFTGGVEGPSRYGVRP